MPNSAKRRRKPSSSNGASKNCRLAFAGYGPSLSTNVAQGSNAARTASTAPATAAGCASTFRPSVSFPRELSRTQYNPSDSKKVPNSHLLMPAPRSSVLAKLRRLVPRRRSSIDYSLRKLRSCAHPFRLAEEALRPEHQHRDQHDEDPDQVVGGTARQVLPGQVLDQPDREATDHRTLDAADPAENRGGEREDAVQEAHVGGDEVGPHTEQHARDAGQRPADDERDHDGPVRVDAHQPGRIR